MMDAAFQAVTRFGLGRKAGEALPANPRGWLLAQLDGPDPARFDTLPDTGTILHDVLADKAAHRAGKDTDGGKKGKHKGAEEGAQGATTSGDGAMQQEAGYVPPTPAEAQLQATQTPAAQRVKTPRIAPRMLHDDQNAQLDWAVSTDAPFRERLVWFWANHFTVSAKRGNAAPIAGAFVREAIRPHVTGRFQDMLSAVMHHPAMLIYLDNIASMGPNSPGGQRTGKGLNENLGRESLELHTVTPASGYSQADVTNYAKILTGWSVGKQEDMPGFQFREKLHEPGPKMLMGRTFPEGEQGGVEALAFLGTHPASYHAVATDLARHFIADTPPEDAVRRIAGRLQATGGNLGAAAAAVVAEPAAWQPLVKLRTPLDYVVAVSRAVGPVDEGKHGLAVALNAMGQPQWTAPLPNGWSDKAADWADPETLLRRTDWAYTVAGLAGDRNVDDMAHEALGSALNGQTVLAMQHAGSRREAMTLLLTSPEFMRR